MWKDTRVGEYDKQLQDPHVDKWTKLYETSPAMSEVDFFVNFHNTLSLLNDDCH